MIGNGTSVAIILVKPCDPVLLVPLAGIEPAPVTFMALILITQLVLIGVQVGKGKI
jgi:hypothetical protein